MKKPVTVIAALAVAFLATGAQAAQPDFSGEWKLNMDKSDYGMAPKPESMSRKIKQSGQSLEISTHQKGQNGETTTELKYTTDGKESVNKGYKGTAKWEGDKLIIDSVRDFQGSELKFHEAYSLSDGGKVITVASHVTVPQGEFDMTFVFEKQ
jgi:hypothetical protein